MGKTTSTMAANDQIAAWWADIPTVARWHFASAAVVTLACNFGMVSPLSVALFWENLTSFKPWVLVTNFMHMGKLGFPFLMHMMFLYQYSKKMEELQGTIEYLFMLTFCMLVLVVIGLTLFPSPFMGMSLVMSLIYAWSRTEPTTVVTFMFGLQFQAQYLPWVLTGFALLMGGSPMPDLLGIAAGHVYHFLKNVVPANYGGTSGLKTPAFYHRLVPPSAQGFRQAQGHIQAQNQPWGRGAPVGGGAPPAQAARGGGYQWGAGNRLGGD